MYAEHFGLREPPFAITPDPAYVYLSQHHREALAHLLYGTDESGGFVQLTGEVGTGKTTLVRSLLEQKLERVDIALCLNPRLTVEELLATVCDELHVTYPREHPTLKALVDALNEHLLRVHAAGRRTVLIVDEAQNLSREVLEQVRLLTNLETTKHKLLRIILVGQPELRQLLARPDLRQLAQRITARYHLPALDAEDTAAYIRHRLRVAGGREDLFSRSALRAVYKRSGGTPRLINILCDRALLGAYSQNAQRVNAGMIRQAAREALQSGSSGAARHPTHVRPALALGLAGLIMLGLGLWLPRTAPLATEEPVTRSEKDAANAPNPVPAAVAQWAPPASGKPVEAATAPADRARPMATLKAETEPAPATGATAPMAPAPNAAAPSTPAPAPDPSPAPGAAPSPAERAAPPSTPAPATPPPVAATTAPAPNSAAATAATPVSSSGALPAPNSATTGGPPPTSAASLAVATDAPAFDPIARLREARADNTNERLLDRWGVAPFQGRAGAFCEYVKTRRLRCLSGQGDWETLRRFDRPAVLRLNRPDGAATPVLLRALDGEHATLDLDGKPVTVPLSQLKPLWAGQYLLLWELQTDQAIIGPGNNGEAVRWLRRRLATAAGQSAPEAPSERFDAELGNQVRAFQKQHGLLADGMAGEQTLLLLNNLAPPPDTPRLSRPTREP